MLLVAAAVVAALGTALVFLYVRGADNRAEEKFETTDVLVATVQIERGERIADAAAAGKLARQAVPQGQVLPGALVTTEGVDQQLALTVIYPGEQIVPQKLGDTAVDEPRLQIPDEGDMAMSINLTDPARVAGFVNPGSEVAIFINGSDATTGQPYSRVLLTRVKVIAVGSTTPVTTTTTTNGQGGEGGQQVDEVSCFRPELVVENVHLHMIVVAKRVAHADKRDRRYQMPFQLLQLHGADAEQVTQDHISGNQCHLGDAGPGKHPADDVYERVDAIRQAYFFGAGLSRWPPGKDEHFRR